MTVHNAGYGYTHVFNIFSLAYFVVLTINDDSHRTHISTACSVKKKKTFTQIAQNVPRVLMKKRTEV